MTGEYLSNLVDVNDIECGKLNLIYAPCGSGKTTFAKERLTKFAEENYLCRFPLFLIDTAIGKEQFLQSGCIEVNPWTNEPYWEVPGIGKVMTYAGYGKLMECAPKYDYVGIDGLVVCDELQNAIQWSKYPDDTLHQKAIETLATHINAKDSTIVAYSHASITKVKAVNTKNSNKNRQKQCRCPTFHIQSPLTTFFCTTHTYSACQ